MTAANNGDDEEEEEEQQPLSEHCQAMRDALSYCLTLIDDDVDGTEIASVILYRTEHGTDELFPETKRGNGVAKSTMDVWDLSSSSEEDVDDPKEFFHARYLVANRPCLIRGAAHYFSKATASWVKEEVAVSHNNSNIDVGSIDANWFLNHVVEPSSSVPVRRQAADETQSCLDQEGRATECATVHMTMSDWIAKLRDTTENNSQYYLKDWHCQITVPQMQSLYTVPDIFSHDLLNSFLTKFTKGDYRFVYWGPKDSFTSRHSDVMNSLSWSFNVHGTKEWTFFLQDYDAINDGDDDDTTTTCVIRQRAGELLFVPARLQHSVRNLEETISINHNWICTANLDLVWECISVEVSAIEVELQAWGLQGFEARENMLRGCVGLDVTGFLFMTLVHGLEVLQNMGEASCLRQHCFDLVRIRKALHQLVANKSICLRERLCATLGDEQLGSDAMDASKTFLSIVGIQ